MSLRKVKQLLHCHGLKGCWFKSKKKTVSTLVCKTETFPSLSFQLATWEKENILDTELEQERGLKLICGRTTSIKNVAISDVWKQETEAERQCETGQDKKTEKRLEQGRFFFTFIMLMYNKSSNIFFVPFQT